MLDKAGQKGTGKWTAQVALDLGARERRWIKQMTAQTALDLLRRWLLDNPGAAERDG